MLEEKGREEGIQLLKGEKKRDETVGVVGERRGKR